MARFVSIKTFIWVIDSDSLSFKNVLVVCWYVIHSQSLTLTSDDLIWSSCGNYYDHTSIVMKIIQKAAELWTAITGHESQHRQVNTWTWSQVTSNHILWLVCSEHNARQQTTLDKWSTDNITSIVLRFIHDILSKIHFSGAGFIFSCKNDILKDLLLCCAAALMCAHLSTLLTPLFCKKGVSLGGSRPWYWSGRRHKRGVFTITEKAPKGQAC